jgi:hypothetical protein
VLGAGGFASDGVFASDGWLMVSGVGSVDGMGGNALVEREQERERVFLPLFYRLCRAGLMWLRRDSVWCCAPLSFSVSETLVVPASRAGYPLSFSLLSICYSFYGIFCFSDFSPLRIALRVEWRVAVNHVKNTYNGAKLR